MPCTEKVTLGRSGLQGGGPSGVQSSEPLALGFLFATGIVSACSKSPALARMNIFFTPSSLAEHIHTCARTPSVGPGTWEALNHGHSLQTALPPTFLTYPARQEAFKGMCCFLSIFSPFQP